MSTATLEPTDEEVMEVVLDKSFEVKPGGLTICRVKLRNGHEVFGTSKASSEHTFVPELGELLAWRNALKKVKELETYLRRQVGLDPSWWSTLKLRIVGKDTP